MALSIPVYDGLIQTEFTSLSYTGTQRGIFSLAVATGVITTTLGLTGIILSPTNIGPSTGTGIIFSGPAIGTLIHSTASSLFGSFGSELLNISNAIGVATATHFLAASLTDDANGTATFPAFLGAIATMKAAIIAAAPGFIGSQWPNFAEAIATGICTEIGNNGTGTLSGAAGIGTGSGIVTIL